jgi:hypothetical protein
MTCTLKSGLPAIARGTGGVKFLKVPLIFDASEFPLYTFSYINEKVELAPPPLPTIDSPPPSPPSPPPTLGLPEWVRTLLEPQILIPVIIGAIVLLIVFIYLFKECTKERAGAFATVLDAIFGRSRQAQVIIT